MDSFDVAVIGAGVIGNSIARELSKTNLSCVVIEKEADSAFGISGRNSGVVHSGIHYAPGSSRAHFCVQGNSLMASLCKELSVPYINTGKLTVASNNEEQQELFKLKEQGEANGVPGLEILDTSRMEVLQPGISGKSALHSPSSGIVNPISLTLALAEHAHMNGVEFRFLHEVTDIYYDAASDTYLISIENNSRIRARCIVNAAGLFADVIASITGYSEHTIYPCRGEYYVLDKRLSDQLHLLVYPVPGEDSTGLGIHLTNTPEGNILIGPSNEYVDDPQDYASTESVMKKLRDEARCLLPTLETGDFIRSFSGNRPKLTPPEIGGFGDFVIHQQNRLIHLIGIESPGLTSAPAIAQEVLARIDQIFTPTYKSNWLKGFPDITGIYRKPYPASCYSFSERQHLISEDPDFGTIICRCEEISLAEVRSAIRRIIGPVTLLGIKQRCRTMTGRCQGGFCLPRIAEILQREKGFLPHEIYYKGPASPQFNGYLRDPGEKLHAL